jgi:hypothetical protein
LGKAQYSLEEMTTPQSRDSRAFRISEQDLMISTGANNNTIETPKHRSLKHTIMGYKQECHIKSKRRIATRLTIQEQGGLLLQITLGLSKQ